MKTIHIRISCLTVALLPVFFLFAGSAYASDVGLRGMLNQLWHQESPEIEGLLEGGDRFGETLTTGDFNGDGFDDLAIGVPHEDVTDNQWVVPVEYDDAGAVNIIYGTQARLSSGGNKVWHQARVGFPGNAENRDEFGRTLAAGDFNGDGFDDLAIGVPREDYEETGDGVIHILYGNEAGLSLQFNQLWHQEDLQGKNEPGNWFGYALAAGDFNGDGVDDLAIGVPEEDSAAGVVQIAYGKRGDCGSVEICEVNTFGGLSAERNLLLWQKDLDNPATTYDDDIVDKKAGDRFGETLAAADFNGDGVDDLAIGVIGEDMGGVIDAGVVHILYGTAGGLSSSGSKVWTQDDLSGLDAVEASDKFGETLAAGDFNGDGVDDLAIGVPSENLASVIDAGAVHILYGKIYTDPNPGLSADGNQLWSQDSPDIHGYAESGDRFGSALASGDFNGDGFDDLAIGVPLEGLSGLTDAGAVHILYGTAGELLSAGNQLWSQDSPCIEGRAETSDEFGAALAAGDFNGDGFDDLAIGVPFESVTKVTKEKTFDVPEAGVVNVLYSNLYLMQENDFDSDRDIDGSDLSKFSSTSLSSGISLSWFAEHFGSTWPKDPIISDEEKLSYLEMYAPQVRLPIDEKFKPSSVEWSFEHLTRMVRDDDDCDSCYWLHSEELDDNAAGHVLNFFHGPPCSPSCAPVYAFWARKQESVCGYDVDIVDLIYYFYYPFNFGKIVRVGPLPPVPIISGNHVGDWEHITVRMAWHHDGRSGGWTLTPSQVYIGAHNFGGIYGWNDVKLQKVSDTHPVVYAAFGSHGNWVEPGEHRYKKLCLPVCQWLEDQCSDTSDEKDSILWNTWELMETFDYFKPSLNEGGGLGASKWPLWMSNDFSSPGDCGDPSDPECGPIYRWGNPKRDEIFWSGYYILENGPAGPVSKDVWDQELK